MPSLSRPHKALLPFNTALPSLVLLHAMPQKIHLPQHKPSNDWLADSIGLMMNATTPLRVASPIQLQANGWTPRKQLQWEPLSMAILKNSFLSASQIQMPALFCKLMPQECAWPEPSLCRLSLRDCNMSTQFAACCHNHKATTFSQKINFCRQPTMDFPKLGNLSSTSKASLCTIKLSSLFPILCPNKKEWAQ